MKQFAVGITGNRKNLVENEHIFMKQKKFHFI